MISPETLRALAAAADQARMPVRANLVQEGVRLATKTPPATSHDDFHYFELSWRDLAELHPKGAEHVIEGWLRQVDRKLASRREEA